MTDVGFAVLCFGVETSGVIVHLLHAIFEKVKYNGALCYYHFEVRHPRCVLNNCRIYRV